MLKRSLNLNLYNFDDIADRGNSVITKMIKLGKAMDVIAQGIREHGMHSKKFNA